MAGCWPTGWPRHLKGPTRERLTSCCRPHADPHSELLQPAWLCREDGQVPLLLPHLSIREHPLGQMPPWTDAAIDVISRMHTVRRAAVVATAAAHPTVLRFAPERAGTPPRGRGRASGPLHSDPADWVVGHRVGVAALLRGGVPRDARGCRSRGRHRGAPLRAREAPQPQVPRGAQRIGAQARRPQPEAVRAPRARGRPPRTTTRRARGTAER